MVTGCGVNWTGGRDMTTSEGVGDSELGLISSVIKVKVDVSESEEDFSSDFSQTWAEKRKTT